MMTNHFSSDYDDQPKPLMTHIQELRKRFFISLGAFLCGFAGCYLIADDIFAVLVRPLAALLQTEGENARRLIYTGLTEAFVTYLKVAAFAGAFVSFPIIETQVWLFIAPGLYKKERAFTLPLLIATPFFFIAGALFAYYVVFPAAYTFFLSFETPATSGGLAIQLEAKVDEYLSFVMRLIFAFGICFELPVFLSLLALTQAISSRALLNYWRYAVLGIFTLSAFITPPDIFSMLALAFPLILLYGLSIMMVKYIEHWKNKRKTL